jgi:beta-galactosidase
MKAYRPMRSRAMLGAALLLAAGAVAGAAQTVMRMPAGKESRVAAQRPVRERISLDEGWRFRKDDPPGGAVSLRYDSVKAWILPTGNAFIRDAARRFARPPEDRGGEVAYVRPDFNDRSWQRVNLPHDWAIAGPFTTTGPNGGMGRLPSAGAGWYRRTLEIPASDAGKSIFLDVDGAMSYATVWLNGHLVGGWPYGYASWRLDLTPYVVPGGATLLAIRLDNPPRSSRWYTGGGIYRHVWLTKTQPLHVSRWGTFVTTPHVTSSSATIELRVTVDNDSRKSATVSVATRFYTLDAEGRRTGAPVGAIEPASTRLAARASATVAGSVTIAHPALWGPPPEQRPNRYVAVTTVTHEGRLEDIYETRFGIRELRFDPNSGVSVNGERIYLRGVNDHHDLGALGAAFNERAAQRQLELLQEMGCNAVRTSHNPPAPELLDLADSMGVLVLDEAFDVWIREKTPLDYHLLFPDWHEQDLRAMVRRDRNHPSVFLWSIGNEVGEQFAADAGAALTRQLVDIVHEEDPTRPTTTAMNAARPTDPMPAAVDVISLNYQGQGIRDTPEFAGTDRIRTPPQYDAFHQRFPGKVILSSETADAFSSRGVYLFPVASGIGGPVRPGSGGDPEHHQVSAYELYTADFGSSPDRVFASLDRHPFVAGEFVWSGWDYLGEPSPYESSRSSYSGIIDLAGFKKDRFYLYQARWRPDYPMAHILPHWTWPERVGQITPVHVFTSGDEGELFLNGRSLGRRTKGPFEYRLRWDSVTYEPGTLVAVTYNHGVRWATDSVRTARAPAALEAVPDRPVIRPDGRDLAFVTVRVTDSSGVTAPRADNRIRFTIEGPGEIVATDNGDPTSFEPFQAQERAAFNGLCLVIVRAKVGQTGRIVLTASSDGLRSGVASIAAAGP